jgi:hypothetical protein
MSIVNEINRLQQAKSDLATSIANKGVTVPAFATLDDYAALVDSIQTGGGGSSLPYDAEVEYLQSDGAQYINTGVVLTKSYTIIVDCAVISAASTYPTVLGALNSSNFSCPLVYDTSGHPYVQVGGSNSYAYLYTSSYFGSNIIHYVCRGDGSYQYLSNGVKVVNKSYSGSLSTLSMYLLARNSNGNAANFAVAKIGRTSINVGGVLLRDYIPVRVGQVGYMYDRVSKTLFGNSGTGSFTLGPDVT